MKRLSHFFSLISARIWPRSVLVGVSLFAVVLLFPTSCREVLTPDGVEMIRPEYAQGFRFLERAATEQPEIAIYDPREEDTVAPIMRFRLGNRLYLSDTLVELNGYPQRIACLSSTHIAFLHALGLDDRIVGVSGIDYISNEYVRSAYESGAIKDVGSEMNLNYEMMLQQHPDLVLAFATSGPRPEFAQRLHELGIPVLMIGDFLEEHPLGRAEWIRIVGRLVGKEKMADSLFNAVASRYHALADLGKEAVLRPKVLLNAPWQETWYIPGGETFIARLIKDAGADPMCAGFDDDAKSHPINIEIALGMGLESDFWLHPGSAKSLEELGAQNHLFSEFKPWQKGDVWNNNARDNGKGGNDFWETGVIEPDEILSDLLSIFHPELQEKHQFRYYQKLPAKSLK